MVVRSLRGAPVLGRTAATRGPCGGNRRPLKWLPHCWHMHTSRRMTSTWSAVPGSAPGVLPWSSERPFGGQAKGDMGRSGHQKWRGATMWMPRNCDRSGPPPPADQRADETCRFGPLYAVTVCVPTNSASSRGGPSSRSIKRTSLTFSDNSSKQLACECAPWKPGT